MFKILKFFIRASSFVGKELTAILRQPRLILSLVLGPFLIMFLFGLGFQEQSRQLRTTLVVEGDSPFASQVVGITERLSKPIIFQGVEQDKDVALAQLALGQTDLVIVVPNNPEETIRNNQQAVFTVYHNEVDPFQAGYIQFMGSSVTDLVNSELLRSLTAQGQEEAASLQSSLDTALADAKALRQALEANNLDAALTEKEELDANLALVRLAIGSTLVVLSGLDSGLGEEDTGNQQAILDTLNEIDQSASTLDDFGPDSEPLDFSAKAAEVENVEAKLTDLNEMLAEFQSLEPGIIVNPFTSETTGISGLQFTPIGFFAPAVIALLLQHISITFAALSIVRERNSGIMELFRVSPLTAFETLLGKFLSYLVFNGLLGLIITVLVIGGLGLPMMGNWWEYALVVFVLLFTSLGLGFLISLVSETDTQAAQFSMLLLMASIFFSGFFLDLRLMRSPINLVSWLLPATYGIRILQDVMLRGYALPLRIIIGLAAMGLVLFVFNWLMLRRKMETG